MTVKRWYRIQTLIIAMCVVGMFLGYIGINSKVLFNVSYAVGIFIMGGISSIFNMTILKNELKTISLSSKKSAVTNMVISILLMIVLIVMKINA